jgi:hypothetical protein
LFPASLPRPIRETATTTRNNNIVQEVESSA